MYDKNRQIAFVGVSLLHLVLFFGMFVKSDKVKIINEGMWIVKIIIALAFAFVLRMMVNTGFFELVSYVSVWLANWVYVFEALVFVDLVFAFNITLDEMAKTNGKIYGVKAVLSALVILGEIILCYYSFYHNQLWVSWVNVGCVVGFLVLAVLRLFEENSILVGSFVGLGMVVVSFYIHGEGE